MTTTRRAFLRALLPALLTPLLPPAPPPPRLLSLGRFCIAGFRYYEGLQQVAGIRAGEALALRPEPTNPYDERAVEIYRDQAKLGYVPRQENAAIFRLLLQQAPVTCRVTSVQPEGKPWEMVEVEVELAV